MLEEANKKIHEANRKTQNLQFLLQAEKEQFARFMGRRVEPGQVVYIY